MAVDPVRDAAIDVLFRVEAKGMHLDESLDVTLRRRGAALSARGRRFLAQLVYGTVRHQLLCDHVLAGLVTQPLDKLPVHLRLILRMAVFQSLFSNQVTVPAMVHTSVDLAKKRGHAGLARLANAVLRRVPHSIEEVALPSEADDPEEFLRIRYSIPQWLVHRWIGEYGLDGAREICEASSSEAPWWIRVNTLKTTRDRLQAALNQSGHSVAPDPLIPDALSMAHGSALIGSKAFLRGEFFIQDAASMLAGHLLAPAESDKLLDACAAPGGKTTHLAELTHDRAFIVAMDVNGGRIDRIRQNVERLELTSVRTLIGDAVSPPFRERFDGVLVDAPCTGHGTFRRHPDLKWRVRPDDPERLAQQQLALLRSAAHVCQNNGVVVYAVCTFTPEETVQVVQRIQGEEKLVAEDGPAWLNRWKIDTGQYRILPSLGGPDGYFLTRLRKVS